MTPNETLTPRTDDIESNFDLADGKYTYTRFKNGKQVALRYGQAWRELSGDNLIYFLAIEAEKVGKLERELAEAKRQAALYNKDAFHVIEQRDRVIADRARWRKMAEEAIAMLSEHHKHHQETLVVYFEQDGKPIEMSTDLGEAYLESDLAERTSDALSHFNDMQKEQP